MKDLVTAFYKKNKEIAKFITERNISENSESNFESVTAYYNSLFPVK
jgi:hypothetical protein